MNERMRWCRLHPKNLNEDVNRRISSCLAPTPPAKKSVDPNVCGCRHLLCCEQTAHAVGKCPRKPTEKMWSFRWEYLLEFAQRPGELILRSGNSDPSVEDYVLESR